MTKHPKFIAWLAFAAVSLFWGTTFLAISIGVKTFPPILMAACRHTTAGIILVGFFLLKGFPLPDKKAIRTFGVNGMLMLAGGNGIISWGMQYVGSGLTALICALTPIWIVLFNRLSGNKEQIKFLVIVGFAICLLGQFILFRNKVELFKDSMFVWGILAIVASNIFWALGTIYSKNHKTSLHPLYASGMQMIPGGVLLFVISGLLGEWWNPNPSFEAVVALFYLILFGSILAYGSYMYVIKQLPATIVSTYAYINTLVAIILGWLWLHEGLDGSTLVAVLLTIVGVFLVTRNSE